MTDRWAKLVYDAKEKCEGCRASWGRLRIGNEPEARWHDIPGRGLVECTAPDLRREILRTHPNG